MQLKNLGNSLGAIEKLEVILAQITNYNNIPPNALDELEKVTSNYSKEVLIAAINQKAFTTEQAKAILMAKGVETAEAKQKIELAGLTTAQSANIGVTKKLSLAWQGLAAKLGVSVGVLNVAAAGIAALSAGVLVYKQYQQAQEESRQAAQEAANTYTDSISSIKNYIIKYEELHTALRKAKGNEEETYNVKKQLLDLQTQLNDKYGDEYGRLNLVADAYKNKAESIKAFNREAAKDLFNDISRSDQNKSVDMMTSQKLYNLNVGDTPGSSNEGVALQDLIARYEEKGITSQIDQSSGTLWIYLNADPVNAEQTINEFMKDVYSLAEDLGDVHIFDSILENSKSSKDSAKDIINDWADIYEKTLIGEIANHEGLSAGMAEAARAVELYNEAFLISENPYDDKNVQSAYNNLQTIKKGIQDNEKEWGRYSSILNEVWNSANTKTYELSGAVKSNQNGIGQYIEDMKDVNDIDLKAKVGDESDTVYLKMKKYAEEYGLSVYELINSLTELGYVQAKAAGNSVSHTKSFTELFSNLPIHILEDYMKLLRNGSVDEKTISSYAELDEIMKKTGLSAEETIAAMKGFSDNFTLTPDLISGMEDGFRLLKSAQSDIHDFKDISLDTLNSIVTKYPQLQNQVLAYLNGLSSTTDMYEALQDAYDTDADAYRTNMAYKLSGNESFFSTLYENNQGLFENLAEAYGLDVENWKTMAQAKAEIDQVLIKSLSSAWSKYYSIVFDSVSGLASLEGGPDFSRASSHGTSESIEVQMAWSKANNAKNKYNQIIKSLNEAQKTEIQLPAFDRNSGTGNRDSKDGATKEFNWMERRNKYLQNQHHIFQAALDDETKSYREQLDALDDLIAADKERMKFAKDAYAEYQKQWEYARGRLTNQDIHNVMEGNINIEEHSGEYIDILQEAMDIYDNMTEYEKTLNDIEEEKTAHIREQLKLREEIIQSQQDEIKAQMDLHQSKLDLIEAQGGVVTERMLKNQILLSEDLIDSYKDKINNLYDQISEVAPDSAAYYSLMAEIDACERAIINCKIQQEDWNERIMRLPIERIQKYLNMLAGIKQDLQNFLDEQSAMGIQPSADQLQQLFDISREEIKSLLEQQKKLKDLLEQYKFGSEKFNDVSQELQDIDNTISGLIQSQKEWNASILQIPIDQMSKLNDTLNLVGSTLDNLLSDYDSALSAVTGVIDKQTESLEELKSAADESYQDKIAPLREELDLLQKQNEERQTEIDLEQKQYNLDKARSQKTSQVVRNGEIIYEADADAIRTANQELSDAEYNKLVKDLGNQISELEEERDKLLESYDTQIEKLNEIKEKWSSIVDEMKLASDISKADEVLGQGWQDKILNGNDDGIYELFKGLYENTTSQKSQLEEQTASNERIAEMMNQFVTKYQEGSLSYEQAMAGIRELSEQMKDGYSSLEQLDALLGLHGVDNLESLLQNMQTGANTSADQLSKYMELVKANADAMNQYASSWEDMQKNIRDQIAALEKLAEEAAKAAEEIRKNPSYGGGSSDSKNNISNGTIYADGTTTITNEHVDGFYTGGSSPSGDRDSNYVHSGPGAKYHTGLANGFACANKTSDKDTKLKLLGLKQLAPDEIVGLLRKSEAILTPEQQRNNIQNLATAWNINRVIPDYSSMMMNHQRDNPANITITMGDTILEHVSKPDEFAQALARQFKPLLRQELSKR